MNLTQTPGQTLEHEATGVADAPTTAAPHVVKTGASVAPSRVIQPTALGDEPLARPAGERPPRPSLNVAPEAYLTVPFADKDQVKKLGAQWDSDTKRWFVPEGKNPETFSRWLGKGPAPVPGENPKPAGPVAGATYLTVPFADKDQVKVLGARFDGGSKQWYVPSDKDPAPFQKWLKPAAPAQQ